MCTSGTPMSKRSHTVEREKDHHVLLKINRKVVPSVEAEELTYGSYLILYSLQNRRITVQYTHLQTRQDDLLVLLS